MDLLEILCEFTCEWDTFASYYLYINKRNEKT